MFAGTAIIIVGIVVGVLVWLNDTWQNGLIYGVVICAIGFLLALLGLYREFRGTGF